MTPILIVTKSHKLFNSRVREVISKVENTSINNLNNNDIYSYGEDLENLSTSFLRDFISTKSFKPTVLKSSYIILYNLDRYNKEMQNIILKILEDSKIEILIQTSNIHSLLETVISRCKIIKLKKTIFFSKEILSIIKSIILEQNLSQISKLCKFDSKKILENTEYFMKKNKEKFDNVIYANVLTKIYELYKNIEKTKGLNMELQLTNIFVSLFNKKHL